MRTRDTVLIAVLINVGLLAILFATARNTDEGSVMVASIEPLEAVIESPVVVAAPTVVGRDEIDQALKQYRLATKGEETASVMPAAMEPPKPEPVKEKPVEVKPVEAKPVEIVVKRGDSLDKIARANGTTVERLIEANRLKTTRLQIGQTLELPGDVIAKAEQAGPAKATIVENSEDYYTVCSGDNPWVIANKFRIPLDELLRINRLDESSAKRLKPGDRIRIR